MGGKSRLYCAKSGSRVLFAFFNGFSFERVGALSINYLTVHKTPNLPKHGSSEGRAGPSRAKGPEFESRSVSYKTELQRVICSILLL